MVDQRNKLGGTDTPGLTATMAESYVTGERFGKGELFREAIKAIALGAHVVVPAAVLRELEVYAGSAAEGESKPAFHRFLAIENTLRQLLLAAAGGAKS